MSLHGLNLALPTSFPSRDGQTEFTWTACISACACSC